MERLRRAQIITIESTEYIVDNMIEFVEDGFVWQEYGIIMKNESKLPVHTNYYLSVEKDENNREEYYLYTNYHQRIDTNKIEFEQNGKTYKLFESGNARVKGYFGPADVDINEKCQYYDYITEDRQSIISVEKWIDGTEITIGRKIQNYQLKIQDEIDDEYMKKTRLRPSTDNYTTIALTFVFFIIGAVISVIGGILGNELLNKSIDKYLSENSEKYTYVTSVTNNSNNKKANVYATNFVTLDETVKDIIDGVPEEITETLGNNLNEEEGYGLETKKEYAYIYMNEDEKIYVQVSDKEYVNSSGTTYHSSHNSHYHNNFSRRMRSTIYYNYATSARQSSINSRSSSGGGTSSGK